VSCGEWKSSDSAPRDGTRIIGWFSDKPIIVFWRSGTPTTRYRAKGETVSFWSDGYFRHPEPDCWQPAPPGPDGIPAAPFAPSPRKPYISVKQKRPRVTITEAPRRRIVTREAIRENIGRAGWCAQCERNVTALEASRCSSPFCKAKAEAA
jgi:hypothetical protein